MARRVRIPLPAPNGGVAEFGLLQEIANFPVLEKEPRGSNPLPFAKTAWMAVVPA